MKGNVEKLPDLLQSRDPRGTRMGESWLLLFLVRAFAPVGS